ncbi:MAG: type VI secretion system baseplate subunit TssG [Desulfobacterium sp.]|nr:type VI secretion system baseplate subunit TssG [Desulfobacterium sp.]
MATQERKPDTALIEQLHQKFYEFSFFKAVTLLENFAQDKKPLGKTQVPKEEAVRFSVEPGFAFPPSEISGLEKQKDNQALTMKVAFMGLIGPSGILPQWYNELAQERLRKKDRALTEFLDIFHHRLISLFYLAWKKHRFPESYRQGAEDRLSRYLLSLAGLGTPGMVGMLGLPRESLSFYSGLLSKQVASAVSIEAALEYFSGARTTVDQFVERSVPLAKEDQTSIGMANARLGMDTVCGKEVRECQTKFRVNLGPVDFKKYLRLTPPGDLLLPVFSLVRYMVGIEFEFELRIILKKEEVPMGILGGAGEARPLLGWSTWIASPEFDYPDHQQMTFQEADLKQAK